ncbi:MAG: SpaH/EbpB family LPXTG-anchored major pilin [Lachnospiraceae bacterium]|nr:SpaH/EbpB family LPXTG-anchored major pilin [Lachnospiraceae bacterium]
MTGTATKTIYVTIDENANICDGTKGDSTYGYDFVISASDLVDESDVETEEATVTNTYTAEETTTTTNLTIVKLEKGDDDTYLKGAEFYLYYVENGTTYYYASYDETTGEVTWTTARDEAMEITSTDTSSGVTVYSLTVGTTYYLEEVTAPDGYNLLSDPIQFELDEYGLTLYLVNDEASAGEDEDGDYILYVYNSKGYELPSTGGMGTWMYTLIGLLLCSGAALVLYRRKQLS